MKALFIDHEFHRKTHSADFFLDVLREKFMVTAHYYARFYHASAARAMIENDVAVIWEFPISRGRFFFSGKRNVFVPMYDNEWASVWQWRRIAWSGIGVISFCDKVTAHARKCGVTNLLDVRYFPDPKSLPQRSGDPKKVFLWERGAISRSVAETLFPPSEGYEFVVKGAEDFMPRDRYLELLSTCGIVIAPRRKEGIGMAFLEAMAMGKCVVAHDDATMNEYIENGKTGILFDCDRPTRIDFDQVSQVMSHLKSATACFHRRWKADRERINAFIAGQPICKLSSAKRLMMALSCLPYWAEGALCRIFAG